MHRNSAWTAGLVAVAAGVAAAQQSAPNVLIVLTDDQGYGDMAAHGNADLVTPSFDAFATESVHLREFTAAAVCSPSRAALLTGRQSHSVGVWGVHGGRDYLNLGVDTLADAMSDAGFRTGFAGKWHLGKTQAYLPHNRGFDESWSITDRLYQHTDPVFDHNGVEQRPQGWTAEILSDLALDFIDASEAEDADRPWMFFLSHPYIHAPFIAPDTYVQPYRDAGLSETYATLCGMIEHLDSEFGRVVDGLAVRGLEDETIVVYLGDNGPIGNTPNLPPLTQAEMDRRNPLGLRGVKGNLYQGGMRAPAYFRWPGQWASGTTSAAVDMIDIAPTLLDAVGIAVPAHYHGVSLVGILSGAEADLAQRDVIYINHEAGWPGRTRTYDFLDDKSSMRFGDQFIAMRRGDYKLVRKAGEPELYDLDADPSETTNLAQALPGVLSAMDTDLAAWWTDMHADAASYDMPVFVLGLNGHGSLPTRLYGPAPTIVTGDLYSDSHSTDNWDEAGEALTWAVRVDSPGWYRFSLDASVGPGTGTFEVSAGGSSAEIVGGSASLLLGGDVTEVTLTLTSTDGTDVVVERLWGLIATPIDEPELPPCGPADLRSPYGSHDFFDATAFLSLVDSGCVLAAYTPTLDQLMLLRTGSQGTVSSIVPDGDGVLIDAVTSETSGNLLFKASLPDTDLSAFSAWALDFQMVSGSFDTLSSFIQSKVSDGNFTFNASPQIADGAGEWVTALRALDFERPDRIISFGGKFESGVNANAVSFRVRPTPDVCDRSADWASPLGVLDSADVQAFVSVLSDGCDPPVNTRYTFGQSDLLLLAETNKGTVQSVQPDPAGDGVLIEATSDAANGTLTIKASVGPRDLSSFPEWGIDIEVVSGGFNNAKSFIQSKIADGQFTFNTSELIAVPTGTPTTFVRALDFDRTDQITQFGAQFFGGTASEPVVIRISPTAPVYE